MTDRHAGGPVQGVLDPVDWEQPPRRPAGPSAAPVLAVTHFEGPLDWLLELARTRRIDLARLSIAELVAAFEDALTSALSAADTGSLLLARWGEWLVMAAELTLLRSRLLVPAHAADSRAAEDEAERLRRALLDRMAIARGADWLDRRVQLGREVFSRGRTDDVGTAAPSRTGDVTALLRACLAALRLPADADARYRIPSPPVWSVLDAVARIRAMLPGLEAEGGPLTAFLPAIAADAPERERRCRTAVSATFLAGLELARNGIVALEQVDACRTIRVNRASVTAETQ